jgi:hypothetical protein
MTTKIFFDNPSDAEKISLNLGEPINDDDLFIVVDVDELALALKQTNISSTAYSVATVEKVNHAK